MSPSIKAQRMPDTFTLLSRSIIGWCLAVLMGASGGFISNLWGLPRLPAAQATIGLFGLLGGFSHALLLRAAGGNISLRQVLQVSFIWSLSGVAGVTPLFFIMGTPLKMAVMAFYSFALSGALGGLGTAYVTKYVFDRGRDRDVMPCIVIWSFSFGLAGFLSEAAGEGLQTILPASFSWALGILLMGATMGAVGGYSVVCLLKQDGKGKSIHDGIWKEYNGVNRGRGSVYLTTLILLALPFYLNDLSNIYVRDWRMWLVIDYTTVKLFPFLIVTHLIVTKKMHPYEFGLTSQTGISFLIVFLMASLAGTLIDQNRDLLTGVIPGYAPLGGMPDIWSNLWQWIDLTFGLLMVGICEEMVFRGYLHTFIARFTRSHLIIIVISSVAFGLIHWSGGFNKVLVTSVVGAVFMALYIRTRSLPAIMLAHFAVNFIDFAGVIPRSIFRFH